MSRIGVAVVGPGRIARAHLRAVRNNADLADLQAVVGLPHESEKTRGLAAEFGAKRAYDDLDEVLADPAVEAVVLTLPNHLHQSVAERAMEAGKHVLVEKPLANTVAEADSMIATAARTGRTLMVGQCRRFFPGAIEAKRRIADLGRPLDIVHLLGVHVETPPTEWWRSAKDTGGLCIALNGPHVVDTILWLVGERPVSVYARTARFKQQNWEGEDQATIVMNFADGSTATGHLSFNMKPHVNERWIVGPNGTMRLTGDRTLLLGDQLIVESDLADYLDGDESFDGQFREFALALQHGREPLASGAEVRGVIEVLSAAAKSAATNQVIEL